MSRPHDEGGGVRGTNPPGIHENQQQRFANDGDGSKALATLTALLAMRGHATHRMPNDQFLVTWRGCARHCRDVAELQAHAHLVGAI